MVCFFGVIWRDRRGARSTGEIRWHEFLDLILHRFGRRHCEQQHHAQHLEPGGHHEGLLLAAVKPPDVLHGHGFGGHFQRWKLGRIDGFLDVLNEGPVPGLFHFGSQQTRQMVVGVSKKDCSVVTGLPCCPTSPPSGRAAVYALLDDSRCQGVTAFGNSVPRKHTISLSQLFRTALVNTIHNVVDAARVPRRSGKFQYLEFLMRHPGYRGIMAESVVMQIIIERRPAGLVEADALIVPVFQGQARKPFRSRRPVRLRGGLRQAAGAYPDTPPAGGDSPPGPAGGWRANPRNSIRRNCAA